MKDLGRNDYYVHTQYATKSQLAKHTGQGFITALLLLLANKYGITILASHLS